jgi:hypothetical protein
MGMVLLVTAQKKPSSQWDVGAQEVLRTYDHLAHA